MFDRLRHGLRSTQQQVVLGVALALACVMTVEALNHSLTWNNHFTSQDGAENVSIRRGKDRLKATFKGEVVFTEDDRGLERLGPGALFELKTRDASGRHSFRAVAGNDGRPQIEFRRAGKDVAFDAAGQDWLHGHLQFLYRRSGVNAEGRIRRFLARDGVDGVLTEILELESDNVQRIYYEKLLQQVDLDGPQLAKVLRRAGEDVDSDHQLSQIIAALDPARLASEEVRQGFMSMTSTLSSDGQLRQALSALISDPLEPWLAAVLLEAAQTLGSDYEQSVFLSKLAASLPTESPLPPEFFSALRTLSSDHEHRRVTSAALERHQGNPESFKGLLEAAQDVNSDRSLATLLSEVAERQGPSEALPPIYFVAASSIRSDYELRRALEASLGSGALHPSTLSGIVQGARNLHSDHDLGVLMWNLLEDQTLDDATLAEVHQIVRNIEGDHERQRLEGRLSQLGSTVLEAPLVAPAPTVAPRSAAEGDDGAEGDGDSGAVGDADSGAVGDADDEVIETVPEAI